MDLPADRLVDPGLIVVVHSPLLLRVASHVRHRLQVSRLRLQPLKQRLLGESLYLRSLTTCR